MLQRRVAAAQLAYETALQILTAGEREGRKNERECVKEGLRQRETYRWTEIERGTETDRQPDR